MMKKTLLASLAAACLMAAPTWAQLDLGGAISGAINGATGGNRTDAAVGAQAGVQASGGNSQGLPSGALNSGAQVNASGSTNQSWLGRVSNDLRNAIQVGSNGALQLDNNSSLQQYGFRPGDQLLGPNGQPLTQAQFDQYLQQNPGQVRVLRNGQTVVINGNAGYQPGRAYAQGQAYQGQAYQGQYNQGQYNQGQYGQGQYGQGQPYQGQYYSSGQYGQASTGKLRFGVTMNPAIQDGALVSGVVMGSPAAQAGIRPGDKIVSVNGQAVNNPNDMIQLVGSANANENLDIQFVRQGREMQSQVLLASATSARTGGAYQAGYAQGMDSQSSGVVGAHGQWSGPAGGNIQQRLDNLERMVQELRDEIRGQSSDRQSNQNQSTTEQSSSQAETQPSDSSNGAPDSDKPSNSPAPQNK